jgi:hypothetical protein
MFTEWSLERHGVYLISFYKVGRNQNRYKKKDGKGRKTLRGWKFWHDPIWQQWEIVIVLCLAHKGEIQIKNLLIIFFFKNDNNKIEEKQNFQKNSQ